VEKRHEIWHVKWDLMEQDHLEDPSEVRITILKRIFKKCDGAWIGLIWLRIGTGGGRF